MSAVAIIRALMVAHTPVTVLVPAARVFAGPAPQGVAMPAITLTEVSGAEQDTVSRDRPKSLMRNRVQVTILANSYAQMKTLMLATKLGAGTHTGMIGAYQVNSVVPAGIGPEIPTEDSGIYEQSRDFMVTFQETN